MKFKEIECQISTNFRAIRNLGITKIVPSPCTFSINNRWAAILLLPLSLLLPVTSTQLFKLIPGATVCLYSLLSLFLLPTHQDPLQHHIFNIQHNKLHCKLYNVASFDSSLPTPAYNSIILSIPYAFNCAHELSSKYHQRYYCPNCIEGVHPPPFSLPSLLTLL